MANQVIGFILSAKDKTKQAFGSATQSINQIRARASKVAAGFKSIGAPLFTVGKVIGRVTRGFIRMGKRGLVAIAGISAGIVLAMRRAQEFNKQMAQVATLADIDLNKMKKQVRSLSVEFGLAKDELTKGLYDAISAGVPKENAFEFLRTASKTAIAGAATTAESVDLLTTAINAFGYEASDAEKVSDILFTAVKQGKALDLDTPIPTPDRGFVLLRDIKSGDLIFNEQGKVERVVYAHEVIEKAESYEVLFDDGVKILACKDHNWLTYTAQDRAQLQGQRRTEKMVWKTNRKRKGHRIVTPTVRTTRELLEGIQRDDKGRFKYKYYVPVAKAVEFPERHYDISPYTLGLWLGDGATGAARLSTEDDELLRAIEGDGYAVTKVAGDNCDYGIKHVGTGRGSSKNKSLHVQLRLAGLLGNKHIPENYFTGSVEQRLALLQGLMDTDGYITEFGDCEFCSTLRDLAYGCKRLADSLGMRAKIRVKKARQPQHKDAYLVRFLPTPYNPFRLQRKRDRVKEKYRAIPFLGVVGVTPVAPRPMRCLTVTGENSLFLVGHNFIVTHNTTISELAASLSQAGPLAAASGVSLEQVAAAAASLTKQGVPTAMAMTQIRAAIMAMNKRLPEGWSATMTLQDGMKKMAAMAGGSARELTKLTGRVEGANAILAMTGSKAEDAAKDLDEMNRASGAMGQALSKAADSRPLDRLTQGLDNMVRVAGSVGLRILGPAIETAATQIGLFAERLANIEENPKLKAIAKTIEDLTASLFAGGDESKEALEKIGGFLTDAFLDAGDAMINHIGPKLIKLGVEAGKAIARNSVAQKAGGAATGYLAAALSGPMLIKTGAAIGTAIMPGIGTAIGAGAGLVATAGVGTAAYFMGKRAVRRADGGSKPGDSLDRTSDPEIMPRVKKRLAGLAPMGAEEGSSHKEAQLYDARQRKLRADFMKEDPEGYAKYIRGISDDDKRRKLQQEFKAMAGDDYWRYGMKRLDPSLPDRANKQATKSTPYIGPGGKSEFGFLDHAGAMGAEIKQWQGTKTLDDVVGKLDVIAANTDGLAELNRQE